jgi:hypothetical protein
MSARTGRTTLWLAALAVALVALPVVSKEAATRLTDPPPSTPFTMLVRADFFSGMAGEKARLEKGMKVCEQRLATHPDDAEALVWHGLGITYRGGLAVNGDPLKGVELLQQGLAEMERATALAPSQLPVDNLNSVLIPHASALVRTATELPERGKDRRLAMMRTAAALYDQVMAIQKPYFDKMSVHRRGELLGGMATTAFELGDKEKGLAYLRRVVAELPDTPYQSRAQAWLDNSPKKGDLTCVTCHYDPASDSSN